MLAARFARISLLILMIVYALGRLVILTRGVVFTGYDSASYAYRADPALNHGPLVSLVGHAPRLWGVPLFYALFDGDTPRAYAQWGVATIAWAALAAVVAGLLHHPVVRLAGAAAVLLVALLPQVSSWDFAILSESLSISLGVLALALFLRWVGTGSALSLTGTVAVTVWWTFTRPDIRVFTVFLLVALVVVGWRRPARRTAGLLAAGALLIAIGWSSAVLAPTDRTYLRYAAIGADEGIMFQLRTQVFPDPAIKAAFAARLGLPACPAADAAAAQPAWQVDKFAATVTNACPALRGWIDQHGASAMTEFAKADPALYLRMTGALLTETLGGAHYASVPGVVPSRIGRLIFPPPQTALWRLGLGLFAALAAVLASRARRVDPILVWGMLALAGVCLVSAESNVVFGVGEFARFGVQEAIGVRVAILVLLVTALDAALVRRGGASLLPRTATAGIQSDAEVPALNDSEPNDGDASDSTPNDSDASDSDPDDSDPDDWESADADRGARGGGPGQG